MSIMFMVGIFLGFWLGFGIASILSVNRDEED